MRILYHHRTASKDGQAVHIEEMIDAMRALGHEVRVVAPLADQDDGRMGGGVGWVHHLKAVLPKAMYEFMELAYSLVAYRKLMATAREFKPDLIYERYNLFLLAGLMVKRRLDVPLLLEVNAPLVFERSQHSGGLALRTLARWAEGKAWRGADAVLPVTAVLAAHVRDYGVPAERIHVIPNGINRAHFAHAPSPAEAKASLGLQGRVVLGFTGFVRDWHGVDRIIDWMAGTDAPTDTHLLVVGDGPVRTELQAQACRLGLGERVTFTGVIHRDQVPAYVAAFDVALQPAVTPYASPLKLMEYLVLGKAVIAPATPNLQEVLADGLNALLFDEAQPGALEHVLQRVCSDSVLRGRLAQGAADTIDRLELTWLGNARRALSLVQARG
ncbi:glycosyltransferase family 4 protein [Alicycliphilus denitrificans]|uniref:Glycosyl transferase group 1 n=1 Tax=Alicycliphilus denitrificans (strain DSM 14773 / CIP 107495 / K601) TaxID=596154 RepID=F4G685_ALIDK|nr:glycosyltransferase family 4 protein [Alicycliphilus denitrificans]AEB83116.1 glycosyl transferase group 1 [Alicycliphilus denitrificans K601]